MNVFPGKLGSAPNPQQANMLTGARATPDAPLSDNALRGAGLFQQGLFDPAAENRQQAITSAFQNMERDNQFSPPPALPMPRGPAQGTEDEFTSLMQQLVAARLRGQGR